jgi:hypothetical protein
VTACHVLDAAVYQGYEHELFIFDVVGDTDVGAGLRPVPLTGALHRAKDPADVAVIALDDNVVSKLKGCRFLRLSEVSLRPVQPGRCWVFGFPVEKTQDIPACSLFRFDHFSLLAPVVSEPQALANYDPRYHFLLDAARDDVCFTDGTPADIPRALNGISGCSIWQPEWPANNSAESWNPDGTRIVGVQTSFYSKSSLIKATHWAAVANVLYQCEPDLRRAIELHFGPAW